MTLIVFQHNADDTPSSCKTPEKVKLKPQLEEEESLAGHRPTPPKYWLGSASDQFYDSGPNPSHVSSSNAVLR